MAIIYKYGKRSYTAGEMKGVVQIDTTGFHGSISANNLTPRNGEQVTLIAEMEEGYTLKCFIVDDENIIGNSFKAHLGTNYVKGAEAAKATQEVLQKPILSLKEVLSLSSDNTKLYKPILSTESVTSNHYDQAPNAILKPAGLIVTSVTTTHYDELKQLEITSITGKWINTGSSTLYQMTIYADKNSMDSDIYINGTQSSLYMGSWTSAGSTSFYIGYFGQAVEGKTYTFNLKKKGYKDSATVTHTVASKETTSEKDIKVSIWSKDYDTDSYPSIVTNGATVKGTENDTYKTIFAKTGLGSPAYLDSSKCSYSYSTGVCYIYGFDNYAIVTPTLSQPVISESSSKYWFTDTNSGSVIISAKIANNNKVAVTAHITATYMGGGIMDTYTISKSISGSETFINPTLDIDQPSAGEIIKLSVYFTASGYEDSSTTTTNITMVAREEEIKTFTEPTITVVSNDCASITFKVANPSGNPPLNIGVDGSKDTIYANGSRTYTYSWSKGVYSMTKTILANSSGYEAMSIDKTFTKGTILANPSISSLGAEYWLTDKTSGSIFISGTYSNPNSEDVTATVTFKYNGAGMMSMQTESFTIKANDSTSTSYTYDIDQPSTGETFTATVTLSKTGYTSSSSVSKTGTLSLREGSTTLPTLTEPTITEVSNDNFSITVRYANPSSNPYAHLSVDDVYFWLISGGYKDITYRWGSLSTMTKICYVGGVDSYLANNASKTFTRPELTTPTAPTLSINGNSYDHVQFNVYNPNGVALDVYDTGGNKLISQLAAKSSDSLDYSYSGNTKSLVCYFMGDSRYYSDSARSSINASRPLNATLSATAMADKGSNVLLNVDIGANYEGTWSLKIYSQESRVDTTKTGSGTGTGFTYTCSGTAVIGDAVDLTLTYTYNGQSVKVSKTITITERT